MVDNEQKDLGVFMDNLTFYQVTTDESGARVELELSSLPTSEAGAVLTVFAKVAEYEGVWQAAKSNDVTLTLEKRPEQSTIDLGSVSGASVKVELNGAETDFVNNTIGLVEGESNAVVITVTAAEGFFLGDNDVIVTAKNSTAPSVVVAADRKTATISFTSSSSGETYTVAVEASEKAGAVIELANPSVEVAVTDLSNISFTDEQLKSDTFFGASVYTYDPLTTDRHDLDSENIKVSSDK